MTGRPSLIDAVIRHDDNGQPVTVADQIINFLRIGMYLEPAIAAAGPAKSTVYLWMHTAGLARIRTKGDDTDPSITPYEQKCIAFLDAVEATTAGWEAAKLTELERAERGGTEVVTITEKVDPTVLDANGNAKVIDRTTRREILGPDLATIRWRLTRRYPDRYAGRVEVTGKEGGPVEMSVAERANALADSLEEEQAKRTPRRRRKTKTP